MRWYWLVLIPLLIVSCKKESVEKPASTEQKAESRGEQLASAESTGTTADAVGRGVPPEPESAPSVEPVASGVLPPTPAPALPAPEVAAPPLEEGVPQIREVKEGLYAFTVHEGPYETIPATIAALMEWAGQKNLTPLGPPNLNYHKHPENAADPKDYVTSIGVPIAPPSGEFPSGDGKWVRPIYRHRVGVMLVRGAPDAVAKRYPELAKWIVDMGFVIAGPPAMRSLDKPDEKAPAEQRHELSYMIGTPDRSPMGQAATQAARNFFKACADKDWETATRYYPRISENTIATYGGLELLDVGQAFVMYDTFPGRHVPYKVKLHDGTIKDFQIAIRNDIPDEGWLVDGGL